MFSILKLGRLLRIGKIISFLKTDGDFKAVLRIFKMILYLLVYLHCYTCLWWIIVKESRSWIPCYFLSLGEESFYEIYEKPIVSQYLISLNYAVFTSLGSDILPMDSMQTIVAAFGIFMGAVINANIFGEL